jgi:flagellar hook-associated protein 3 FlgL
MRIADSMIAGTVVTQMQKSSTRLFELQQQVASGLAFTRPSENPAGAVRAAFLRSGIAELERFQANCNEAEAGMRMTEIALGEMADSLREAQSAALAMTPFDDAGNAALADQVHEIAKRIAAGANSTYEGRYLFAGYEVRTKPVVENAAGPPPYTYAGDRGDIVVQLSRAIKLVTNFDAAEVLNLDGAVDAGRDDLLETLRKVEEALRAGDSEAIQTGLTDMDWHFGRVVTLRGQAGTGMQQVEMAKNRSEDGVLTLQTLLSEVQDVDISEAIIGLRSQEVAYQAAAAAASSLHRASLLEYF